MRPQDYGLEPPAEVVGQQILFQHRHVGGISARRKRSAHPFVEADLEVLGLLADQAAIAIENANRYARERATSRELERAADRARELAFAATAADRAKSEFL